ncbi:uncharacterized protein SOCE26_004390 [Sorangium cellulosum]|uniref:Uncharacterized protein n=1 Tax=Sorangium cellulosum TaxID=56 RepID=A0A2L0EIF0_SORCE|nr:hypothetical protein [Sorangium cellulosum]AUX39057.1 uncharacterized protein SOCE26_004390 [Sorangium cellulosum]
MSDYGSTTEPCLKREYVIVVGAEDYYERPGNKMMFMAQAVRYVRRHGSRFDIRTVLYFRGGPGVHTDGQVAALTASVKKYGGTAKEVRGWGEVASHINTRTVDGCQKRVQVLIFFAHGSPGRIWLSADEGLFLTAGDLGRVDAGSFTPKRDRNPRYTFRHVTSWACQTGNAGQEGSAEQNLKNSLAQEMADSWDIQARASITQTNYGGTWAGWRPWDTNDDRRNIDNAVWEDDGADGSVVSGGGSAQGDMPTGMYLLNPGQSSGYRTADLD